MKKSLVVTLALVFVLGLAGTALAANPFTDVPANHWAYASVSKLAQAGIIEGYGDGRFIGNNNMTRFEMAQIVAKAMAKADSADASQRAQIEKLAAEFADELDSLGVRVAKLEKNADNVKITGEARFSNWTFDNTKTKDTSKLRTRIWISGQVNEQWRYGGMLENNGHDFKTNTRGGTESTISLRRAWVQGSLGAVDVTAGRFAYKPVYGVVFDNDADGIKLGTTAGDFKINLFALRMDFGISPLQTNGVTDGNKNNQVLGAEVGVNVGAFDVKGAYYHTNPSGNDGVTSNIYEVAAGYKFNKDWKVWAEYLRGSKEINDGGKSGWAARLDYGKTVRNKPGTWSAYAAYYDVPAAALIDTTPMLDLGESGFNAANFDGYKGWAVGASVMLAKNIDLNVEYFDFDRQNEVRNGEGDKLLFSYLRFYF